MTWLTWCLLLGGVLLNAAAQLLLKAATRHSGELVADSGRISWSSVMHLLGAVPLWIGLACYGVSLIVWLGALSRVPVSVAYPMLSIGYVINAFAAAMLFGEALSIGKLAGIAMICAGVITLARLQHS
ncbi:MAG TPA: SMR family transporter [Steroidobacteraceae bacterium]|jgi:multidrug transporter EmrE-like cation transporter|nr:SMR family transporter [Steroidobacteraceae bacterium]